MQEFVCTSRCGRDPLPGQAICRPYGAAVLCTVCCSQCLEEPVMASTSYQIYASPRPRPEPLELGARHSLHPVLPFLVARGRRLRHSQTAVSLQLDWAASSRTSAKGALKEVTQRGTNRLDGIGTLGCTEVGLRQTKSRR